MDDNKNILKVINEDGIEIVCDVLFTFDNADTGKSYIVYTDNTKDESGNVQVYASIYDPTQKIPKLETIETAEEWKVIETILESMQENIQNGVDDVDELIHAVQEDIFDIEDGHDYDDLDEIMDDFGYFDPFKDIDLESDDPIVLKLHVYENNTLNHSAHMPHTKIGEVIIDGTCGTVSIGSNIVNDISITEAIELLPIHAMLVITHRKVMISNIMPGGKVTINDMEVPSSYQNKSSFFEIQNGDYFTLANQFKVYVEIVDPADSCTVECQLCGKKFIKTMDDVDYCVDCRKQLEEEMGFEIKNSLKLIDLNKMKVPNQKEDLNVEFINFDKKSRRLIKKIFRR